MKLELHNDLEGRPPYTVVSSTRSDDLAEFFTENGVQTTVERDVFRAGQNPYDFVHFSEDADHDELSQLIARWNADERAAKRASR